MSFEQPLTVVLHCYGFTAYKSQNVIVGLITKKLKNLKSIQFIPGGRIRVTFKTVEARNDLLTAGTICLDGIHHFEVTESDAPSISVFVHYLPMEAGEDAIKLALRPFGEVTSLSHQVFPSHRDISTGTRIVKMSLNQHIPFEMTIMGYPCRVWYRGQPVKCVICKGAHKAAECPDKNKCRRCHQPGHVAKDCTNAWGTVPPNPNPPVPPRDVPTNPPPAPGPSRRAAPASPAPPVDPPNPPPPLMSIVVPDHSDHSDQEDSQAPLVSDSDSQLSDSQPSPHSSESQSILRGLSSITRGLFKRSGSKIKESVSVGDPNVISSKHSNVGSVVDPKVIQQINVEDPKVVHKLIVEDPKVVHKRIVEDPKVVLKPKVDDPNVVNNSKVGDPKVVPNSNVDQIVGSDPMVVDESVPATTGESDVANASEASDLNVVSHPVAPSQNSDISLFSSPSSPPSVSDPAEDDISDFTDESSNSSSGGPRTSLPPLRVSRSSSPARADGRSRSPIRASAKHRMPPIVGATPKKSR